MGYDLLGMNPKTETGKYFGNTISWWGPLWSYCDELAHDICDRINCDGVDCNHVNCSLRGYGYGLDDDDSFELAEILQSEIESGHTAAYAEAYMARLKAMPDQQCSICGGTGKRRPPPETGPGTEYCNGCYGKGTCRPDEADYRFTVANVQNFVAFLKDCGGFEVQ